MNNVAAIDMVKCEGGGCFARIRPGERFCTRCEQMYVDLETKRIEMMRRGNSVYPQFDCCEAEGFPAMLLETTVRERVGIAVMCVTALAGMLGLGTLLFLGGRDVAAYLLKVSATS